MAELPYGFDPEAQLPGDGEQLLSQIMRSRTLYGDHPELRNWMVHTALRELLSRCNREARDAASVRYWMLMAHVNTQDAAGLRRHLNYWWDWRGVSGRRPRVVNIGKFAPGEHYHVDGQKFDTLALAQAHIRRRGWSFGVLEEHYFPREGD